MKNLRELRWLTSIFLVLLLALIIVLIGKCNDKKHLEKAEQNRTCLFGVEDDVCVLTIRSNDGTETAFRFDSSQKIESATYNNIFFKTEMLDSTEISNLLKFVSEFSLGSQFDVDDADLSNYGLAPEQYTVTLKFLNGSEKSLAVGNLTSNKNGVYVCEMGKKHVMIAEYNLYKFVSAPFEQYLSRVILDVERTDMDQIEYHRKSDGDAWILKFLEDYDNGVFLEPRYLVTYPMEREPDIELITLSNMILQLQIAQYVPIDKENLASYGLLEPEHTFILRLKNGEEIELYLSTEIGGYYYGYCSNNPYAFCVAPGMLPGMNLSSFELIDSSVIHGYLDDVRTVKATIKDKTFVIEIVYGSDFVSDDTLFTIDQRNAKVYTSEGDCYGLLLFGSIFNMPVSRVDYDVKPALADVEATISVVKTNSESIILKLVPCGDSEYYCFLNDSYSGFIVDRSVLYKDNGHNMSGFGVWDAYLLANEAIDNKNTNDVYNRP